jgi:hypothetical protein
MPALHTHDLAKALRDVAAKVTKTGGAMIFGRHIHGAAHHFWNRRGAGAKKMALSDGHGGRPPKHSERTMRHKIRIVNSFRVLL